jgi:pimeloyl-ACP methyl ester carboxylesterase
MFIASSKSGYINDVEVPSIKKYFPNFSLKVLDAGHWVHSEKPSEFMEIVEAFYNSKCD